MNKKVILAISLYMSTPIAASEGVACAYTEIIENQEAERDLSQVIDQDEYDENFLVDLGYDDTIDMVPQKPSPFMLLLAKGYPVFSYCVRMSKTALVHCMILHLNIWMWLQKKGVCSSHEQA